MGNKPIVAVYRDHLLSPSETFVLNQAEALQQHIPYYLGSRLVRGVPLPEERTLVVNSSGGFLGKAREASHKLYGWAPTFVKQVRNLEPLLVHAHFGPDGVRALPLTRALRVPLLVTFHGSDATVREEYARHLHRGHRTYLRRREELKHKARLFIAVSKYVKGRLLEQGFPADKIIVHYVGVDTELFRPNPSLARETTVLFVGRLVENKGVEYLIQAMSRVQTIMPGVKLVVIGDGPLRSSLERFADDTLRHYRFLGIQPQEMVRAWMNKAKVFCVPSVTAESGASEGFGLVFVEAQAMGLPVASFATGGISEAVAHGETGLLADEGNVAGLSSHILRLLRDEVLWRRLSLQGRRKVCASFNLRKQVRILEGVYETLGRERKPVLTELHEKP